MVLELVRVGKCDNQRWKYRRANGSTGWQMIYKLMKKKS